MKNQRPVTINHVRCAALVDFTATRHQLVAGWWRDPADTLIPLKPEPCRGRAFDFANLMFSADDRHHRLHTGTGDVLIRAN